MHLKTSVVIVLSLLVLSTACGKKKKKIKIKSNQPLCSNGVSYDPEVICTPLGSSSGSGSSTGSTSGSTSGVDSGSTSGSTSGSSSGASAGSTSGVSAGSTSGSDAGSTSGVSAGSTSGSDAGSTSGVSAGSTSGADAGSTSGASAGSSSGSSSGSTSGGSGSVPTMFNGLIANILEGDGSFSNVSDFKSRGIVHDQVVFLNNFDIPSRAWDAGFVYGENQFVKNKNGDNLIEWFALAVKGYIQLPDFLTDASYDFAAISDDGLVMRVNGEQILSSPNLHGPQVICSEKLVDLSKTVRKNFELDYFQGPRNHIALSLYIKRIEPGASAVRSSYCTKEWITDDQMKEEGWTVVPASYFFLPEEI